MGLARVQLPLASGDNLGGPSGAGGRAPCRGLAASPSHFIRGHGLPGRRETSVKHVGRGPSWAQVPGAGAWAHHCCAVCRLQTRGRGEERARVLW